MSAHPFIKAVGGKRKLLPVLLPLMPTKYNRYFEPFLGGGAVFFEVGVGRDAWLSDYNPELVNCWQAIMNDVGAVVGYLGRHHYEESYYYKIRAEDWTQMSSERAAARTIFLNKTCFNGLYRVNSKGQFNVPFGRYEDPKICDEENLRAVAETLNASRVRILRCDFADVLKAAEVGDFVYIDSPYVPVSKTSFTKYTKGDFAEDDHRRLAKTFGELTARGVLCMLSNSDTPLVRELYAGAMSITEASRSGAMNSVATKRGRVGELVIRNYA